MWRHRKLATERALYPKVVWLIVKLYGLEATRLIRQVCGLLNDNRKLWWIFCLSNSRTSTEAFFFFKQENNGFQSKCWCYTVWTCTESEQLKQHKKCIALRNKTKVFNYFFCPFVKPFYIIKTYKSYNNRELYNTQIYNSTHLVFTQLQQSVKKQNKTVTNIKIKIVSRTQPAN